MLVKRRGLGRRRSARGVNLLPDGGCWGEREIPQRYPLGVGLLLPPHRRGDGEIERAVIEIEERPERKNRATYIVSSARLL